MSLHTDWVHGMFSLLHQRLIDHIQAGRADLAYESVLALCLHLRRYTEPAR
jgi:hypothetical protein